MTERRFEMLALGVTLCAACAPGTFDRSPARAEVSVAQTPAGRAADGGKGGTRAGAGAGAAGAAGAAGMQTKPDAGSPASDAARPDPDEDAGKAPPPPDAGEPSCPQGCVAAHASGTCVAGKCHFSCTAGYADCDGDLERAQHGNGCEAALALDVTHCGQCDHACRAPGSGYTSCDDARCVDYRLDYTMLEPTGSHGTQSPKSMPQSCPDGTVVTGFDGFVDDNLIADSLRLHCSPLTLSLSASGMSVSVGEPTMPLPLVGANGWEAVAMTHTPYAMQCAAGEVVHDVLMMIWAHWGDAQGVPYPTIKDFGLRCAKPAIVNGQLSLGPSGALLATGVSERNDEAALEQDNCGEQGVLRGFQLSSGTNIDQMVLLCASARAEAHAE